jgi:hypothetical protein
MEAMGWAMGSGDGVTQAMGSGLNNCIMVIAGSKPDQWLLPLRRYSPLSIISISRLSN